MSTTEPTEEPTYERWAYGGTRRSTDGKRLVLWVDATGRELLFGSKRNTRMSGIGSIYKVEVKRHEDGGVTMVGAPEYTGDRHPDESYRQQLAATSRIVETRLSLETLERRQADPLDEALEPLLAIARGMRPADRTALVAYVVRKMTSSW